MFYKQNEKPIDKSESFSLSHQTSVNEKRNLEYEPTFLNPYL